MTEHEWEQEHKRPFDWQDRVVIAGGWIAVAACIGLLLWGG